MPNNIYGIDDKDFEELAKRVMAEQRERKERERKERERKEKERGEAEFSDNKMKGSEEGKRFHGVILPKREKEMRDPTLSEMQAVANRAMQEERQAERDVRKMLKKAEKNRDCRECDCCIQ